MDIVAEIKNWSAQFLPADLFVVNVEENLHKQLLTIYIDGDNGIDISACQKLSRHLSEKLDEQDFGAEPYTLEVSSPGADSPLLNPRQYPKHIGREFFIKLNAQTELTGKLQTANSTQIEILIKDKKNLYKNAPLKQIAFADIAEASIILSFK